MRIMCFTLSFSLLIHQLRRKDSKNATSKEIFFAKKIVFLSGCVFMMSIQIHTDVFRKILLRTYAHIYAGVFFQNITVSSVSVFLSSPSWP